MLFGRRKDSVATPAPNASQPIGDTVTTPQLVRDPEPGVRELARVITEQGDDLKWLKERFEKLQNRVTAELREIRREVDRFFDEPAEDE